MTEQTLIERIPTSIPNLNTDRLAALRDLIPEAFTEGKVDFDKLRAALGDVVDGRPERYSFTWAGKRDAIRLLQTPSSATLVPAPEESVNWDTTQHLFIEGDNLEVLKLLYKAYFGKVKLIYIDPPYNTGNDFVYPDDFADPLGRYLEITGQKDAAGNLLTSNPETSGRYHSAWLNMLYPRLTIARQLLRDDGIIAVSIDDNELANLRLMMNEVFGEENFFSVIAIQSNKRGQTYKQISKTHEYLLIYFKTQDTDLNELEKEGDKDDLNLEDEVGRFNTRELRNRNPKFGRFNRPNLFYPIFVNPKVVDTLGFSPVFLESSPGYIKVLPLNSEGKESCWRWGKSLVEKHVGIPTPKSNLVARLKGTSEYGIYEKYRKSTYKAKSIWDENEVITEKGSVELRRIGLAQYFDFPKPVFLIKKLLMLGTDEYDIVLDFFSGSATTAQAVLELNLEDGKSRPFILVQLPEPLQIEGPQGNINFSSIADIGMERIRRVANEIINNKQGKLALDYSSNKLDLGFRVFKLAPSTIRGWRGTADPTPGDYVAQMDLLREPLVDGWRPEDVVWEIAIKEGYPLTSRVTTAAAAGHLVYRVEDADTGRAFHACLDDKVDAGVAAALGLRPGDLLVVRDAAVDDTAAANLALQCRLKTL